MGKREDEIREAVNELGFGMYTYEELKNLLQGFQEFET